MEMALQLRMDMISMRLLQRSLKTILMLLLHVMTTLIKLICVNTALFSITYQDGESLAVVDEQDFNVTPAGDDDVLKVILVQISCFTTNWTGRRRSSCRGGCKRS